jgi:hypothetical protein
MDVHCTTCGEPWDAFHLWHDAIWETGLSEGEIEMWKRLASTERLTTRYRKELRTAGYEFGQTMTNLIRCPACPPDAKPDVGKLYLKAELENLLGGDDDGLAATYEEHGL